MLTAVRRAAFALAIGWPLTHTGAQGSTDSLILRSPGQGRLAQLLGAALATPHDIRVTNDLGITLPRDSVYPRSLVIVGGDVRFASTLRGDLLLIGGDLFLRPGARIEGRVTVVGGCVYPSALATVARGEECFRDATYDATPTGGGLALTYRALASEARPAPRLPYFYGFRIPTYTRVDGLSLAWGPRFAFDSARVAIEPALTYRSDLGEVDPSVDATARVGRRLWANVRAERGTLSNDRWIYSDLINSFSTLTAGRDSRNYFRADRAEARVGLVREGAALAARAWVGGRVEQARSVRAGGPWSLFGRSDSLRGIVRPNPAIDRGRISSALVGARADWDDDAMAAGLDAELEVAPTAPGDRSFAQATIGGNVAFPTFGSQRFSLEAHVVVTSGDNAPRQRFAYLGGSGTLPTLDVLSRGGDRLVFVESRYSIPMERVKLPFLGSPVITLRHMIGSAGVRTLPTFSQNLALRVTLTPVRAEFVVDPDTHATKFSAGFGFGR
ncbi:MAG: hypothetical protein WKG32_00790 [Gemmatimonadaceae bacterium]